MDYWKDKFRGPAPVIATGGLREKLTRIGTLIDNNEEQLMKEIAEASEVNNVDSEKARKAALASVRSKYYRLFWNAAKKQDVEKPIDMRMPCLNWVLLPKDSSSQESIARINYRRKQWNLARKQSGRGQRKVNDFTYQ